MEDDQEEELMKRAKWEGEGVSGDEQAVRENWSHGKRQAAVLMKEDHAAARVKVMMMMMMMMMTMTTMMSACCAAAVCAIVQSSIRLWKYILFFSNDFGVTLLRLFLLSISSFLVLSYEIP
jgi:hypothetical protein